MKNKIQSYICIFLLFSTYFSYSQTWQWSSHIGSNQFDASGHVVVDDQGNSYWKGNFDGFCYFQNDTSNIVNGSNDFFLVKYNSSGIEQWWRQIGGNNPSGIGEGIGKLCYGSDGHIYMTGGFYGNCFFGSNNLLSNGNIDFFLAKYDTAGNCLWSTGGGSFKPDGGNGLTMDNDGFIYIIGTNNDTANISGFILPPGGFIAKYDTSGYCIWAKRKFSSYQLGFIGTFSSARVHSIIHHNGNMSISGYLANDTAVIDTTTIYSRMTYYFLSVFDTSGSLKWVRTFGGPLGGNPNFEHGFDASGNMYVTGTSTGQGYFQTDTISGPYTAFVVKFDSTGTEQWVRGINSSVGSWGNMVSSDGDGNVYVTGRFRGNTWFGNYNITATTNDDMFIARYNSNGDCLGVRTFGEAEGFGVTQDNQGNAYVCGNFSNTITIGSNTYNSYGNKDVFIAKLDELLGVGDTRQSEKRLLIYANPNAGKCNIVIPEELINEKDFWLTVYDNMGRRISHRQLNDSEGKISMNLEHQAKGIYQVTLGNEKVRYFGRILFE
jgi:hypothetical protein